jgi:hypothetical protein
MATARLGTVSHPSAHLRALPRSNVGGSIPHQKAAALYHAVTTQGSSSSTTSLLSLGMATQAGGGGKAASNGCMIREGSNSSLCSLGDAPDRRISTGLHRVGHSSAASSSSSLFKTKMYIVVAYCDRGSLRQALDQGVFLDGESIVLSY